MHPEPDFGFEQIVKVLIHDVLDTVAERAELSPARKSALKQAIVCSIMAMQPRDPLETMLAGQCIVYDRLLLDGAQDILRGQDDEMKIRARAGVLAAGKLFLRTLSALDRLRQRPEAELAFARRELKSDAPPEQTPPVQPSPVAGTAPSPEPRSPASLDQADAGTAAPPRGSSPPAKPVETLEQAVAALAELITPGKVEAILLGNLTPEERRQYKADRTRVSEDA